MSSRCSGGASLPALRSSAGRVGAAYADQEFLVFNQELATLLKGGHAAGAVARHPAAARRESDLQGRARRRLREGQGGNSAVGRVLASTATCSRRCIGARCMAGERSGNLDAVIRRYVAYEKVIGAVRERTISALIYPAILVTMMLVLDRHHRPAGGAGVFGVLSQFGRPLPLSTRIVVAHVQRRSSAIRVPHRGGWSAAASPARDLVEAARAAGADRPHAAGAAVGGRDGSEVRRPRSWRERWRRCWAAASRWSTRWRSRPVDEQPIPRERARRGAAPGTGG